MTGSINRTARPTPRQTLLRGVLPVIVGIVVGALLGLGVTAVLHKKYAATARVLVTATGVNTTTSATTGGRTNTVINMDTEAQLVTSAAVIQDATNSYRELNKLSFDQLVKNVAVQVPANTQILEITYTADTAVEAQNGANAVASAYLDNRGKTAQSLLTTQEQNVRQSVTSVDRQLQSTSQQISGLAAGSKNRPYLSSLVGVYKQQINAYDQQLVALSTVEVTPGNVVTSASKPTSPSSPSRLILTASATAIGLVLGLIVAWLLLRFRRRVRTAADIAHVVNLPCLAVLPKNGARGDVRQAVRRLALVARSAVPDGHRILVTAPLSPGSSDVVAAGLAGALHRSGTPTSLARIGRGPWSEAQLRGILVGTVPSSEAMSASRTESLADGLERMRGDAELLVVDAPGTNLTADAQAVAGVADAVILVIDAGSRAHDVRDAVDALDAVGAPILGAVLVHPRAHRATATDGSEVTAPALEPEPSAGLSIIEGSDDEITDDEITDDDPAVVLEEAPEDSSEADTAEQASWEPFVLEPPEGMTHDATVAEDDPETPADGTEPTTEDTAAAEDPEPAVEDPEPPTDDSEPAADDAASAADDAEPAADDAEPAEQAESAAAEIAPAVEEPAGHAPTDDAEDAAEVPDTDAAPARSGTARTRSRNASRSNNGPRRGGSARGGSRGR